MLTVKRASEKLFDTPQVIFTLYGNKISEQVIFELSRAHEDEGTLHEQECFVFSNPDQIARFFQSGEVSPDGAVALFDEHMSSGHFSMLANSRPDQTRRIPSWAYGAHWAVAIHEKCRISGCARQIKADLFRRFKNQLEGGSFPWGNPRKNERPPTYITLSADVDRVIQGLNSGPDMAAGLADASYASELPAGSRISWYRIAPEPVVMQEAPLKAVTEAMLKFEQVCNCLIQEDKWVRTQILSGVHITDPLVRELYVSPPTDHFSVARPDLHYKGPNVAQKLFATEDDEMPGGLPELVHLDSVYGLNQKRWQRCFEWLTDRGMLLFVVSHEWSKCYIPEMSWLAQYLQSKGYNAKMVTTNSFDSLSVESDGVHFQGEKVGTIWRQFPIFETRGMLVELVKAARYGLVRMVPEFGHFGNKVWFPIFRTHAEFFQSMLDPDVYAVLDDVLPDSRTIDILKDHPLQINGTAIGSLDELLNAPLVVRDQMVLKVGGANNLASRSYGVLMGHGISQDDWQRWILKHQMFDGPMVIQRRMDTGVEHVPVQNMSRNKPELFGCRILFRAWTVGNELVSVSGCAVPSNTLRIHGRVDMAMLPVQLE